MSAFNFFRPDWQFFSYRLLIVKLARPILYVFYATLYFRVFRKDFLVIFPSFASSLRRVTSAFVFACQVETAPKKYAHK
jgi:hypothetical protein